MLIESKDGGLNAIAKNMMYPAYSLTVVITWTWLGEYFSESVSASGER